MINSFGYTCELTYEDRPTRLIGFGSREEANATKDFLERNWSDVSEGMQRFAPKTFTVKKVMHQTWLKAQEVV